MKPVFSKQAPQTQVLSWAGFGIMLSDTYTFVTQGFLIISLRFEVFFIFLATIIQKIHCISFLCSVKFWSCNKYTEITQALYRSDLLL